MKFFEKRPMLMILIGILGISLSSIFVRYSAAPSALTAAWRLGWTVLLLAPAALGKKAARKELLSTPRRAVLLAAGSGLALAVHFVLWFESLQHTSVASSTTIVCTEVIWVCLGYCLFMKGRLPRLAAAAIAVTLAGSVLIALADAGGTGGLYGDILALLAAVAVAVYTLIGRALRRQLSTTAYTFLVYIACAAVLAGACAVQGLSPFAWGAGPVIVGLLLAVFSTILGHSIFSWCLKYFSPAFVSASKLCEPVVAGVIAAFVFAEIPVPLQLAGGALVLGGVVWYSRIEAAQPAETR